LTSYHFFPRQASASVLVRLNACSASTSMSSLARTLQLAVTVRQGCTRTKLASDRGDKDRAEHGKLGPHLPGTTEMGRAGSTDVEFG
jgi:hypothetical protein